ncbi:MAG: serine/threonine-protein kinase [Planctomycetota bacterium]|nr:serine/threonine-protein kinase [Planctomycetota bacterium]
MNATENPFSSTLLASGLVTPSQLDFVRRLARHRLQSMEKKGVGSKSASGAVPKLEENLADNPSDLANSLPDRLIADLLVEQSILTRYQSDQLCSGRTKLSLGPYIITDWIGQGGMGQVFKAVHQVMGRECAVKVLPIHKATPETLQSFRREIRMQAQLDCPYLVRAYDAGQDGNVHYLVAEYVPGMDLRRLIKSRGPLPIQQAAGIIMQAALGLQHAHEQGLIHRDVKPGNILVTPEGIAKVSDVGLAGFASDLSDDPRAGKIVGTADYLSPEQIRTPLLVQPVSDIYSLGCTLYYAICGKVPFPGGDTQSKIRRHLSETPWHPRKFQPDLTEEFVDIIADLMEKDPRERTQTAAEVAARLEPWAGDARELTSVRLTRGPWMAPPPPMIDPHQEMTITQSVNGGLNNGGLNNDGLNDGVDSLIQSQSAGLSEGNSSIANASQSTGRSLETSQNTIVNRANMVSPLLAESTYGIGNKGGFQSKPARQSHLLAIAMTVAIVVPPALVIGAILGFLLRHTQQ